jgi:hypothetical protein
LNDTEKQTKWRRVTTAHRREETAMPERKAVRERAQKRHLRDKAVIDHLVRDGVGVPSPWSRGVRHGARTASGVPVQEQVRKEWTPDKGGLPIF